MAIRRNKLSSLLFGAGLPVAPAAHARRVPEPPAPDCLPDAGAPDSVLNTLNALNRRLEHALTGLRDHTSAELELRAIAAELLGAVRRAPDIAVGAVLLNQIAGSYGVRHCIESAIVLLVVAQAMGRPDTELLVAATAALTMNVGMGRQSDLFHGREGPLSSDERAQVRRHPQDGVDLLRWAGVLDEDWLDCVLLHHEQEDGSGYPEGRMGEEIAENAKLIGAADRYCAMVSARNYRRSLLPPDALARLGAELSPPLQQAFAEAIGAWPPGALVQLASGEVGVVAGRADDRAVQVCVLRGADGVALAQPLQRFSNQAGAALMEALHEDQLQLRFTMQQVWGPLAAL